MAATATRSSNNSPHTTKMSSPKDNKRGAAVKVEDSTKREPQFNATSDPRPQSPPRITTDAPSEDATTSEAKSNAAPLAPPPRPNQGASDSADYFSGVHNTFSLEPNPFEQSFGNPSTETPGRSILPPVASITSPSPLPGITPGWNSLRSGPLSPAMLPGPTGDTDYFNSFRGGFPTPNESSLRTGLTPGGTGSMFPAPSPGGAAAFFSSQMTPGSTDFQNTALRAAAQSTQPKFPATSAPTSQPAEATSQPSLDRSQFEAAQQQRGQQPDMFGQTDVTSVANDLLSFASQGGGASRANGQYNMQNQPPHVTTNMAAMSGQVQEPSPVTRRGTKGSIGSVAGSIETGEMSANSSNGEQVKANARPSRSRKGTNNKTQAANRRKAEETPAKAPAAKKAKTNSGGSVQDMMSDMDDSEDDTSPKPENGKKMTDEEKRKNFLERNRVAALKCRQRKKQWLANLQAKVELFSTENDALSAQVTQLREEIVNLKTLLIAHKDCPVSQSQGLSGLAMNSFIGDIHQHANPYGMAMQQNGHQGMIPMGQGLQRT